MANYSSVYFLTTANATTKNLTTSSASWNLNPPQSYDAKRKYRVAMSDFSMTNFFLNVSAAIGNNVFTYVSSTGPTTYTITIPDGSYSVDQLSQAINNGVINAGNPTGLITLTPDFSTGTVLFTISTAGWKIQFPAGSPYVLLGCTLAQSIPTGGGYSLGLYSELAPNQATFNSILSIYIHTSLTNDSIFAGIPGNVLQSVIPVVPIGSVQDTEPTNLIWIPATTLPGQSLNQVSVYLTDQNGKTINMVDDYSVTLLVLEV